LAAGKILGIIGESGSGKSTLARLIAGLDPVDQGEILIDGRPLPQNRRDRYRLVQLVFQNSQAAMNPRKTIRQTLAVVLRSLTSLTGEPATDRMVELLEQVGLSSAFLPRRPHELSGGQAQRVGIARALACQPKLLILDEPTSALDVSIQAQILGLLQTLQTQYPLTMVLISHDLAVVERLCDQAIVLKGGKVMEAGAIAQLYAQPKTAYTQHLLHVVREQSRWQNRDRLIPKGPLE